MTGNLRLKIKRAIHKHCTLIGRFFFFLHEHGLTILKLFYKYTRVEQISKQMLDNEPGFSLSEKEVPKARVES